MSSRAEMKRRAAERRAQKKHTPDSGSSSLPLSQLGGDTSSISEKRGRMESNPYRPSWSITESDSYGASASAASKSLAKDLCSSFILPKDRLLYDSADPAEAAANLMGHLSLVRNLDLPLFPFFFSL